MLLWICTSNTHNDLMPYKSSQRFLYHIIFRSGTLLRSRRRISVRGKNSSRSQSPSSRHGIKALIDKVFLQLRRVFTRLSAWPLLPEKRSIGYKHSRFMLNETSRRSTKKRYGILRTNVVYSSETKTGSPGLGEKSPRPIATRIAPTLSSHDWNLMRASWLNCPWDGSTMG